MSDGPEQPNVGGTKGAFDTTGVVRQTHVGGQALIEGVMMRGRYNWAVAVREPAGTIYTEQHELASGRKKNRWMHVPVVRGVTAFVESLALGYKAIQVSADHAYDFDEDDEGGSGKGSGAAAALLTHSSVAMLSAALSLESEAEQGPEPQEGGLVGHVVDEVAKQAAVARVADAPANAPEVAEELQQEPESDEKAKDDSGMPAGIMTLSMVLGIVLGVVLFVVLPAFLTNIIVGDYTKGTLQWNVIDGVLRVAVFVAYIALISLMPDIKRMFAYHGAEHKTIHCYEHDVELTPANAQRFPRLHVRCGTAFLIMTMIIAIFVFTVVPVNLIIEQSGVQSGALRLLMVICSRIILLPVVAGLAYEITVRWAGSRPENPLVKVVLWPGLQMQRLTTNQPDDGMLECAITSMKLVLEREERERAATV